MSCPDIPILSKGRLKSGSSKLMIHDSESNKRILVKTAIAIPVERAHYPWARLSSLLIPVVGLIYLVIGLGVWLLKPDRRESWVFLLFCAATSSLLTLVGSVAGYVWLFIGITIPFVGATAFHLFTTYPIEPAWIVRHRELFAGWER